MRTKTIIIVDDDLPLRGVVAAVCRQAGYNVLEASDGIEGLKAIKAFPPDLVITDYQMPRMDGIIMAEDIRRLGHTFPIVFVSGALSRSTADRMAKFSPHMLNKPFTIEQVRSLISDLLADMAPVN